MTQILVADDDINIIASLKFLLCEQGFQVIGATTAEAAVSNLKSNAIELVLMDMNFHRDTTSGQEGLDLLSQIAQLPTDTQPPVIAMTGWATIDLAVAALKFGARDFVQKPWQDEALINAIQTQLKLVESQRQLQQVSQENQLLKQSLYQDEAEFIAQSPAMTQLLTELQMLAQSNMNILLTGENGTGKSLLANKIHSLSKRCNGPFICANMGAIPESLFESEMFGHVKGAFTDAKENRAGRFQLAQKGTLFLDEIANVPLSQQAKLLRVLEERQFEALGSTKTQHADVRIVSATNADLAQAIGDKLFRQDLYYRLNTVTLRIPALRERTEDILPLAHKILHKHSQTYQKTLPVLSTCAEQALLAYHWPGNVRELSHCLERALFICQQKITAQQLSLTPVPQTNINDKINQDVTADQQLTLEQIEHLAMEQRLAHFNGNVTETARSLGLSRSGYYRRLHKYESS